MRPYPAAPIHLPDAPSPNPFCQTPNPKTLTRRMPGHSKAGKPPLDRPWGIVCVCVWGGGFTRGLVCLGKFGLQRGADSPTPFVWVGAHFPTHNLGVTAPPHSIPESPSAPLKPPTPSSWATVARVRGNRALALMRGKVAFAPV